MKKSLLLFLALFSILSYADKIAATGDIAPHLPSPLWLDGKVHRIADHQNKKIVVLFFWNTDQRALKSFPMMNRIVQMTDSKKVAFLGIGNGSVEVLKKFPGVLQLKFPVCADNNRAALKSYMRGFDRLPLAVVIDRSGRINWRGSIRQVPAVLKQILENKFNLAERIRTENFSNAVNDAIKSKNYEKATALIRAEWDRNPKNLELLSMHLLITAKHLKKYDDAFKLIADARKKLPGNPDIDALEFQLITASGRKHLFNDLAARVIAAHRTNPRIMIDFAAQFSKMKAKDMQIAQIHAFLQAGWRHGKFKNDAEKANYAIDYAKLLHSFGRTDLAYKLAVFAEQKLKGQSKAGAAEASAYYKKIIVNAPKLDL